MIKNIFIVLSIISYAVAGAQTKYWGKVSGQWRNYYMATWNEEELKDFQTLATGGHLKYTYDFKDSPWTIAGAMYTSINLGIQDLTITDPATGKQSRYEAGMYDVQNLSDRLILFPGELHVQYERGDHQFTLGRMKFKSPFLNPEDGRMIPTLEQGVTYQYANKNFGSFQLGAFNAIAPRSSNGFDGIGESIGIYPQGRGVDGRPSQYDGHTFSDFLLITSLDLIFTEQLQVVLWNYYADNLFNSIYVKPVWSLHDHWAMAGEWLHQTQVGDGGNAVDSLRYFTDERSNILGVELSWKPSKKTNFSVGYDRITSDGRFLFPREWGREFLFSFQKRERSEGSANNHALLLTYEQGLKFGESALKVIGTVGKHWKPDVSDAAQNKYAHPDYTHINLDLFYTHSKIKSLKPELLLVYKMGNGHIPDNPNLVLNKVNMFQINFVLNYSF